MTCIQYVCVTAGNETVNQTITMLLRTGMTVGGLIAFVLDNIIPGMSSYDYSVSVDVNTFKCNGAIWGNAFCCKVSYVHLLGVRISTRGHYDLFVRADKLVFNSMFTVTYSCD